MWSVGLALCVLLGSATAADVYWWKYSNTGSQELDIKQLPCKKSCSISELEAVCLQTAGCMAFDTNGWLKDAVIDMAPNPGCDLYVKHLTPRPSSTPTPSPPPVLFWPLPTHVRFGTDDVIVSPDLTVLSPTPLISAYADRLLKLLFSHTPEPVPNSAIVTLNITVSDASAPLVFGVDESYTLSVPANGTVISITANTTFGAYWALQTLCQAIRFDFDAQQFVAHTLEVNDAPKFSWRGLLIDTDRHWLSLKDIFRIVDALTYTKLNTLHWHIVDWQAWPLQSKSYPKLWQAAWSPGERYTLSDVVTVIKYANERGVRVVPEFDTPGHASSMCVGYPSLCCSAACGPGTNSPLSPVPDSTGKHVALDAIQAVLAELSALSPDIFFHLGGDEVNQKCWNETASVREWMSVQSPPLTSTDEVYEYFVAAVDEMTLALGKVPIRWEEVWNHFGTALDNRTVIHAWLTKEAVINVTNNGYRAIWSVDGLYYLPDLDEAWQMFYDVDILEGITNTSAVPLVLGGETAMWGETADGSDVIQTIFPRAAAAAERQWSYDSVTNSSDPIVGLRLQAFRCFLLERGIPCAPLTNSVARSAPTGPGSCMRQ